MGDTIWVDVRGRSRGDLPRDNSIMLRMSAQLDRLSKKLKVPKLSDFYDSSEAEAQYADFAEGEEPGEEDEAGDDEQVKGSWFDAGQALAAVRAIHDHLAQHPEDLGFKAGPSESHWPGQLMKELKHCRAVLEKAAASNRPFRFLIVP
jgi:hypothetical protein